MKKVILIIILFLSFISCQKEEQYEYHEMIFQYVMLPEKIVVLYDTNLQDVPIMNKALRFAKESDPVRYQQKQDMIVEINRLRAENRYELYKPYYEAELNKQKLLEQEKQKQTQEKTKGFDGPSFGF